MIGISTTTFDIDGSRIFQNDSQSEIAQISRRTSRTKTLDGGVAIFDGGYCAGDRTLVLIQADMSIDDWTFCQYILKNYSEVIFSCSEGTFLACPDTLDIDRDGNLKFTFLAKEEI